MYAATESGKIWSHKSNRYLKPWGDGRGYKQVDLRYGPRYSEKVHRLIMLTFVGPSSLCVNHINGVKYDNRLDNLEYCTQKENVRHAWSSGLCKANNGESVYNSKFTEAQVREILKSEVSQKELSKIYGVSHSAINKIKKRKNWAHVKV